MRTFGINKNLSLRLHGTALVIVGGSFFACSQGMNDSEREQVVSTREAIWAVGGGNIDEDSLVANTVVNVERGSTGCSGTLITPNVVLTAEHCITLAPSIWRPHVYVGRDRGSWLTTRASARDATPYPSSQGGGAVTKDVAIVWLSERVLEEAIIVRPLASTPPLSNQTIGIAGWSPSNQDGTTNQTYVDQRTSFIFPPPAPLTRQTPFSSEATWTLTSNAGNAQHGDSGGPLFIVGPGGRREVFGVTSQTVPGSSFTATIYSDITAPTVADWLNTTLLDRNVNPHHLQGNWYGFHKKDPNTMWVGEVDYTGPCQQAADADCDHWYNETDDCPFDYDPDQVGRVPPMTCAQLPPVNTVINGATQAPAPYSGVVDETVPIGGGTVCKSGDCPVGFCYWTSLHGPFWALTSGDVSANVAQGRGTSLAITTIPATDTTPELWGFATRGT